MLKHIEHTFKHPQDLPTKTKAEGSEIRDMLSWALSRHQALEENVNVSLLGLNVGSSKRPKKQNTDLGSTKAVLFCIFLWEMLQEWKLSLVCK